MISALQNTNLFVKFGASQKAKADNLQARGLCIASVVDDSSKIERLEKQLRDATKANNPSIKWCDRNLHISWRLFSDVLEGTRDAIINQVKKSGDSFQPFKVKLDKLISCCVNNRCYVILASSDEVANNIHKKNKETLDKSLSEAGVGPDIHKPVGPHLTIAKYTLDEAHPNPFKIPEDFNFEPVEIPVDNIGIFESIKQDTHNDTTLIDRQDLGK